MTEGTTIHESLLELRKDIDHADGILEPQEKLEAVSAVLGRVAGLLEANGRRLNSFAQARTKVTV